MKLSYPTDGELEERLASAKQVDVCGICFDPASDRLRPESKPVLGEIAGVLSRTQPPRRVGLTIRGERLRRSERDRLQRAAHVAAASVAQRPTLSIDGHTDNVGGDAYNLDLSRRRSEAVHRRS